MKAIKKITLFALVIVMVVSTFSFITSVSAASDGTKATWVLDFSKERENETIEKQAIHGVRTDLTFEDHWVTFKAKSGTKTPMLSFFADFSAAEAQYVRVRIKNNTNGNSLRIDADVDRSGKNMGRITMDLWEIEKNQDAWMDYTFKVTENITKGEWTGDIGIMFFYGIYGMSGDQSLSIDYMAFFESAEDAYSFDIDAWEKVNPAKALPANCDPNAFPSFLLDYTNKTSIEKNKSYELGKATYSSEGAKIESTSNRTRQGFNVGPDGADLGLNSLNARYIKLKVKNPTNLGKIKVGFAPDTFPDKTGTSDRFQACVPIDTKMTEYKEYIFDLADISAYCVNRDFFYRGSFGYVSFDYIVNFEPSTNVWTHPTKGDAIYVEYIAFFATEEQAEKFDMDAYRKDGTLPTVEKLTFTATAPTTERPDCTCINLMGEEYIPTTAPATEATTTTEATTAATTTEAAVTTTAATTAATTVATEKTGCGSSVALISIGAFAALGATVVSKKKKR